MDEQKHNIQSFYTHTESTLGRASVSTSEMSQHVFEQIAAHRYSRYPYLPELMEFAQHPGERVLEVGVGEGTDHLRWHMHAALPFGVDLTMRHVQMSSQHISYYGYLPRLVQADAENLPFASKSFDLVYTCGVLFLCPNMGQTIAEIHRVLKPGGRVIALFYTRSSLWRYSIHVLAGVIFGEHRFMDRQTFNDWYAGDGYNYPHVQYVDEGNLVELFQGFHVDSMRRDECDIPGVKGVGKMLSHLLRPYAPWLGYYLTIKARKQ